MLVRPQRVAVGSRPGSLVPPDGADPTRIRVIDYDTGKHEEHEVSSVAELEPFLQSQTVSWIDVQGLADVASLEELARLFGLHPLALEDAVNVPVPPKSELYAEHQLVVARMIRPGSMALDPIVEQVTFFIGPNWLVTIQERHGDVFDPVRRRTRNGPRLRRLGPDYLAYALLDVVVDSAFPVVEAIGEQLELLEDEVLDDPRPRFVKRLTRVRRLLQRLRRSVRPQRDAISMLMREESPFVSEEIDNFLRDVLDHAVQLADTVDHFREMTGSILDLYMSHQGNQMNQVMKVLTIVGAIFIPLTFMAGIYGMNFSYMPELGWRPGYFVLLGLMVVVAVGMVLYFRRKGWLGTPDDEDG